MPTCPVYGILRLCDTVCPHGVVAQYRPCLILSRTNGCMSPASADLLRQRMTTVFALPRYPLLSTSSLSLLMHPLQPTCLQQAGKHRNAAQHQTHVLHKHGASMYQTHVLHTRRHATQQQTHARWYRTTVALCAARTVLSCVAHVLYTSRSVCGGPQSVRVRHCENGPRNYTHPRAQSLSALFNCQHSSLVSITHGISDL